MLIGRESECARLDELLDLARMGRSGALVIRGEAGIGKTALLDYAAARARDMTVVRALGVESEAQLEFSGLLEVCWPMRDSLDELPGHQAGVLRSALGIGPAEEQDRFSVGAATLSLLAAAAEANPVCVVVDDAQWLDPASQDALVFATKRLQADRAAVLFGARDGEERPFEAPGVESISLTGLPREAATELLGRTDATALAPEVADRLYEATHGNPLALLELPGLLSAEQLAGTVPLEDPLPAGPAVERTFARRVQSLPESSQRALVVAAVSTSGEAEPIVAGVVGLGLPAEALEPAEDAGLIRIAEGRLEFRHPLVRSAVYHAAQASDRRAAHRALADALAMSSNPEARAWHLAGAGALAWVSAVRGDEARCREYGEQCQRRAAELGARLYGLLASLCFGLLDLGYGRVDRGIGEIEAVARYADDRKLYVPGLSPQLELAEARIRGGGTAEAEAILTAFEGSELASVPLFRAHAERCRGLLADDGFDARFATALELHAEAQSPFALARTRLCYGERLRRAGRRVEAREQLRAALETFDRIGAKPWSERVGAELRATGETLRRREPHETEELTPQELQIALQVAEGKTNKEVGAALFLSHKTIEFHLSRIYRKLDIHSRAELIRLYASEYALAGG